MEPTHWTISKLVQKFLDKEIRLPEMQRKYVWKQEKVRALIDSIYKDYPSGSILLWETDKLPETRSAAVEKDTEHKLETTLLLLDGQQRLTSLATVLSGITTPEHHNSIHKCNACNLKSFCDYRI